MKKIIVAIDGHSSCGKSTMAKALARQVNYIYVDTGAMYRAVTLYCMEHHFFCGEQLQEDKLRAVIDTLKVSLKWDETSQTPRTFLNGRDVEDAIRTLEVSSWVSPVAAVGFVREALVRQQQEMGREKGIVMDGRDVGTVIFPQAELKIFVTASAEIRAQRRYDELRAKGQQVSYEDILHNVKERDYIDSHRKIGPLRQAEDALLLDNSNLTIPQQQEWLLTQFHKATGQ